MPQGEDQVRTQTDDFKCQAKALCDAATSKMSESDVLATLTRLIVAGGHEAIPEDWVWLFTKMMAGNTLDFVVQLLDEKLLPIDQVRGIVVALCDPKNMTKGVSTFTKELLDETQPLSVRVLKLLFDHKKDREIFVGFVSSIGLRAQTHMPDALKAQTVYDL
jgi:hypothetical protein